MGHREAGRAVPVGREQANEKPGPQREQQRQMPTGVGRRKDHLERKKKKNS